MGNAVALVVFVTGLDGSALGSLDAALERALGSADVVRVQAVPQLPRDVDALELAEREGASAVVELETRDDLARVDLRVCPVERGGECQHRSLAFSAGDARSDRERAMAIVAVAMLPEATRRAAAPPAGSNATPVRSGDRAPPPPPSPRPPPLHSRYEAEAAFSAALGHPSTFGGMAGARVRAAGPLWLRAAAGVRAGAVGGVDGSTLEIPVVIGFDARWLLGGRLELGMRLEGRLQSRVVTIAVAEPERRQRWLAAVAFGPELHVRFARHVGLFVHAGLELNAGRTEVARASGPRTSLDVARGTCEVGPYLTF